MSPLTIAAGNFDTLAAARLVIAARIGAQISPHVRSYRMPTDVADIVPQWRNDNYVRAGDETLIIDPATHAIVEFVVNE